MFHFTNFESCRSLEEKVVLFFRSLWDLKFKALLNGKPQKSSLALADP